MLILFLSCFLFIKSVFCPGCLASLATPSLVQVSSERSSSQACCTTKNLLSCQDAEINTEFLDSRVSIDLGGVTVDFISTVAPNGYVYKNENGDEAIITYNRVTGNVFGSLKRPTGQSYAIEKCASGHTWRQFDVGSFKGDEAVEADEVKFGPGQRASELRSMAAADNVTSHTYSVMFYFTPQFAAITTDIPGYIDQVTDFS